MARYDYRSLSFIFILQHIPEAIAIEARNSKSFTKAVRVLCCGLFTEAEMRYCNISGETTKENKLIVGKLDERRVDLICGRCQFSYASTYIRKDGQDLKLMIKHMFRPTDPLPRTFWHYFYQCWVQLEIMYLVKLENCLPIILADISFISFSTIVKQFLTRILHKTSGFWNVNLFGG